MDTREETKPLVKLEAEDQAMRLWAMYQQSKSLVLEETKLDTAQACLGFTPEGRVVRDRLSANQKRQRELDCEFQTVARGYAPEGI